MTLAENIFTFSLSLALSLITVYRKVSQPQHISRKTTAKHIQQNNQINIRGLEIKFAPMK